MALTKLDQLHSWLIGSWSNRTQAFSQPAEFAHVVLEVSANGFPGGLLLSQRYNRETTPYRKRLLSVCKGKEKNEFVIKTAPVPKEDDKQEDTKNWDACSYKVTWDPKTKSYSGSIDFCQGCMGEQAGRKYCLIASLNLQKNRLETLDRGVDPATKEHIWGQRIYPFVFERVI